MRPPQSEECRVSAAISTSSIPSALSFKATPVPRLHRANCPTASTARCSPSPAGAVLDVSPSLRAQASRAASSFFPPDSQRAAKPAATRSRNSARIAREHGMLLEGPNCLGMVNYVDGIPLTFVVTPPAAAHQVARRAILSQSGALAAVIAVNMRRHAIPLSYSVSTGNEASHRRRGFRRASDRRSEHARPRSRRRAIPPATGVSSISRDAPASRTSPSSCCIPAAAAQRALPPPPTPAPSPAIMTSCAPS